MAEARIVGARTTSRGGGIIVHLAALHPSAAVRLCGTSVATDPERRLARARVPRGCLRSPVHPQPRRARGRSPENRRVRARHVDPQLGCGRDEPHVLRRWPQEHLVQPVRHPPAHRGACAPLDRFDGVLHRPACPTASRHRNCLTCAACPSPGLRSQSRAHAESAVGASALAGGSRAPAPLAANPRAHLQRISAVDPARIATVGTLTPAELDYSRELIAAIPDPLREGVRAPFEAVAIAVAAPARLPRTHAAQLTALSADLSPCGWSRRRSAGFGDIQALDPRASLLPSSPLRASAAQLRLVRRVQGRRRALIQADDDDHALRVRRAPDAS